MRIPVWAIPKVIMDNYKLWSLVHNGMVTCLIRKGMYGLPQAGHIAFDDLVLHLEPYGYVPAPHTPGLWRHKTRPTTFTLVVDDFGVKYTSLDDVNHLVSALEDKYKIKEDWTGSLYTSLTIDWDYDNGTVDISMPGYYEKALKRFQHATPAVPEDSPHAWDPPKYGTAIQYAEDTDTSPSVDASKTKLVQEVVATFQFSGRTVDPTTLVALSSIATQQNNVTEGTMDKIAQLLNYASSHPNPMIRFKRSDMQLEVSTDSSYLSVT
jgi:hypothetical protein